MQFVNNVKILPCLHLLEYRENFIILIYLCILC